MGRCKRILAFALAFLMIIACAACGKSGKNGGKLSLNDKQMASKDYVYSCTDLNIGSKENGYNYIQIDNGYIVGFKEEYIYDEEDGFGEFQPKTLDEVQDAEADEVAVEAEAANIAPMGDVEIPPTEENAIEEGGESTDIARPEFEYLATFYMFDLEGKAAGEIHFRSTAEGTINGFLNDNDGNMYFIYNEYGAKDNGMDNLVLYAYSNDGTEMYNIPLGENVDSNDWYTASISKICDDKIVVLTNKGMDVFNLADGSLDYDIIDDSFYQWAGLYQLRDGSFAAMIYDDMAPQPYLLKVDIKTGKTGEKIDLPFDAYTYSMYQGQAHDFIINANGGVYTYNVGDSETKFIMDAVASDCESENISRLYEIDDRTFIGDWYSTFDSYTKVGKFTKVNPEDIKDKTQILIGVINLDDDVRRRVLAFNKTSDEYKLAVKYYPRENGYDQMVETINNEVISGNMPDILIVPSDFSVQNYISKGLIEDLYPFMDNDAEINKEDYLENIFEAGSEGEHMYQLFPRFYMETVVAKRELVGDKESITMAEMEDLINSHPEVESDFGLVTKADFIRFALRYNLNQFVNWETGEVNFNSEEFIKVLEHTDRYPVEIEWDKISEDYWQSYDTMYIDNRAMFDMAYIYDFRDYAILKQATFANADINFIGFPNDHGKGNVATPFGSMMISGKSPCKEGAWEFLRYFLLDEYQDSITSGFPVKESSMEKLLEKAKAPHMAENPSGEKVEEKDTVWMSGTPIELKPLNDADAEEIMSLIRSIDALSSEQTKIEEIINEEALSYYNKQKAAADVANIIQSRVQIYVDEVR